MEIHQLHSFPIEQVTDLTTLEQRLGDIYAGRAEPKRILALSQRFEMRPAIDRLSRDIRDLERLARVVHPLLYAIDAWLRVAAPELLPAVVIQDTRDGMQDAAAMPDGEPAITLPHPQTIVQDFDAAASTLVLGLFADLPALQAVLTADDADPLGWLLVADALKSILWRHVWLKEQRRFYEHLAERRLRRSTYLLLNWSASTAEGRGLAAAAQHATGRPVERLEVVPNVLPGPYQERMSYLEPERPGDPYLAVLLAYDMRGEWDATSLHMLLNQPFDVALAIDLHTLGRNQAMRMAELAYNTAKMLSRDTQLIDVRAQRVQADSERVMHALTRESLHLVQLAVLVSGETREALDQHVSVIQGVLGSQLRLVRPAGVQGEALKLWSTTPANEIELPWSRRAMLSHGVGCLTGIVGFHRVGSTTGCLWGIDLVRGAPVFVDMFRNEQAGHTLVLGKSGAGKTFFLNLLALRSAVECGYRVIGIDAFENSGRVERAAGAGARSYRMGSGTTINVLDIVYDQDTEGGWLPNQIQYVMGLLSLLTGDRTADADGQIRLNPRTFSIAERGLLDRALLGLYATYSPQTPLHAMPILHDLIVQLEQVREPEARAFARDLRMQLYGTDDPTITELTSLGARFNGTTTVDWRFSHDIVYLDFTGVDGALIALLYALAIGAVLRDMRDPHRDRSRKTLLLLDEFGLLAQVEALANLAATLAKVARKYGFALVVIDQNPATFYGTDAGRRIAENCNQKVLFHLDDLPARSMGQAIADLTPDHLAFLTRAGKGQALAVIGNDVYAIAVEPTPFEKLRFSGS